MKVDHHLQLGWKLHRQIGRRDTAQNFIDEVRGACKARTKVYSIADQPPALA
jgi:hypothetical protein